MKSTVDILGSVVTLLPSLTEVLPSVRERTTWLHYDSSGFGSNADSWVDANVSEKLADSISRSSQPISHLTYTVDNKR